ncbi:putative SIN-like protein [Gregarina niphandrodes]|uniref:SIN-like protein n=1 Tax=Gregarina niphandrodes TaxID=110365 RepID=A0A023B1J0_GRENI|nr:putative SIN-like protein [Gregarina niphandrodes]EZG47086.1 putative SIN-like protein [Gregarina niphandrodes]|eukprot:XP_011132212.1 putative SIN-like protein [Gregarina niphandrodes]
MTSVVSSGSAEGVSVPEEAMPAAGSPPSGSTGGLHGDRVVRRVPVYLNRIDESSEVSLLQCPLRPVYRPYGDHGRLVSIARGVDSKKLQMKYELNTGGPHYDEGKRQLLEHLQESKRTGRRLTPEEEVQLESLRFHKLCSTRGTDECDYAIGLVHRGRFFLTPVGHVLQLKPDFSHLDQEEQLAEKSGKQTAAAHNEEKERTPDKATSPLSADATAPAGAPAGLSARLKVETPGQKRRAALSEPYQVVDSVFDADSPETADIVKQLVTFPIRYRQEIESDIQQVDIDELLGITSDSPPAPAPPKPKYEIRSRRGFKPETIPRIILDGDVSRYYETICSGCAVSTLAGTTTQLEGQDAATSAGVGVGPLSFLALSRLSIKEQVRRIMSIRQMEYFADIKQLVTSSTVTDEDLVKYLGEVAIPIHGIWVASSEVAVAPIAAGSGPMGSGLAGSGLAGSGPAGSGRYYELEKLTRDVVLCLFVKKRPVDRQQLKKMTQLPSERLGKVLAGLYNVVDGKYVPRLNPDPEFMQRYPTLCAAVETEWSPKRAQEIMKRIAEFNAAETSKRAHFMTAADGGRVIDTLDSTRVRTLVTNCLSRYGASSEDFVLEQVRNALQKDIERDISEQLEGETSSMVRSKLLETHNAMAEALKSMNCSDIRIVLLHCAINLGGLWVLQKIGNHHIDPYRALVLSLYKRDMEAGITKKDFHEACIKHLNRQCDLPDVQYRAVFKEVSVNISGRWYFKGSKTVQDGKNDEDE